MSVLSYDAAATDLSPITGLVIFSSEMTFETVQIEAVADSTPEPSEVFYAQRKSVSEAVAELGGIAFFLLIVNCFFPLIVSVEKRFEQWSVWPISCLT